jgi:hypothetical protein
VVGVRGDHRKYDINWVAPRRGARSQEAHHREHSFVDELRELLNAGIEFDEKYLF